MKDMVEVGQFKRIQKHIMHAYGHKNRFAVIGGPGTGKTVLALEGLNRILSEEKGDDVLFLVYNRALHSFLKRFIRYSGDSDIILLEIDKNIYGNEYDRDRNEISFYTILDHSNKK